MSNIKYEVNKEDKKVKLFLDYTNPLENGIAHMLMVKLSPFAYKVPNSTSLCIELGLSDSVLADYLKFLKPVAKKSQKKTKKKV